MRGAETSCKIQITGKPKAVNKLFLEKTSQRLAVSCSVHNLKNFYMAQYYTIFENNSGKRDSQFKKTIKPMWAKMISKMKKKQQFNGNFFILTIVILFKSS